MPQHPSKFILESVTPPTHTPFYGSEMEELISIKYFDTVTNSTAPMTKTRKLHLTNTYETILNQALILILP